MRIRTAFWAPAVGGLVADLLSKHLIFAWLGQLAGDPKRVPLLAPWLVLELHRNTGGVFGVLQGKSYLFVALSILALGAVAWMLRGARPEQRLLPIALGLVVAGALGNLVDRLWLGYVRDFIYIEIIRWPAFNVADTCICVAAGMLFLEIVRAEVRERRDKKLRGKNPRGASRRA
jgi:signal peptidase II